MYYSELLLKFYQQLIDYYKKHSNEFSTLPNEKNLIYEVKRNKYYLINEPSFYYSDIYANINNHSFDFDFIASCLEKSFFIKIINYCKNDNETSKIDDFLVKETLDVDNNIKELAITTTIMSYFVKKIRSYYQKDFMQNSELIDVISKIKHQLTLLYIQNRPSVIYNKKMSQEQMIENIKQKQMLLMDGISEIIDNPSFNDLVLKQQKLYLEELNKIDALFQEQGNKLRVSSEVFHIFHQFIKDFKDLASKRIISLEGMRRK